jgi:NAD+ synthase
MIKDLRVLNEMLVARVKELGGGCKKAFFALSGGIDSSTLGVVLCESFGPENVVGMYRNIRSNPQHIKDVQLLQSIFGFKLICIDGNLMYDEFLSQAKAQFEENGLPWVDEKDPRAEETGFTSAYASLKSRFTTPMAGFISKAIDNGNGRIFGTGNGEEDGLLRYFDKFGDGAVDNNILNGLTKAEVRQLARYLDIPEMIICKTPSADLEACGDDHNDEGQLTKWARSMGYDIDISYGTADGSKEGNIAWAWKEDLRLGVITGERKDMTSDRMRLLYAYYKERADVILFLREIEAKTRHKVEPIPGLDRRKLIEAGVVDE